jgi:hypothetical protein
MSETWRVYMNRSLDVEAAISRLLGICVDQAPVLLPAAAVVFVFGAILADALVALASSFTLIVVVLGLAWATPSG